jgi:hypothetical protein
MVDVQRRTFFLIWALILLVVGAGWAVYFLLSGGDQTVFAVVIAVTLLLVGGAGITLRPRSPTR